MNDRTRSLVILIPIILGAALAAALAQCGGEPATPLPELPTWTPTPRPAMPPTWTPTPIPCPTPAAPEAAASAAAPDEPSPTPTLDPVTVTQMALQGTILPSPTDSGPTPTPTRTQWEQAVLEDMQRSRQGAASFDECKEILQTEASCAVYWEAREIRLPEWDELFLGAVFYLVKYNLYGGEFLERHNQLVVEMVGYRLNRDDFNTLLGMNRSTITDENRELVARAFVLMSLPDYLEEEVVFSDWQEGDWPGRVGLRLNYAITAWTKIQGLKVQFYFLFDEEGLYHADGYVPERNVGDYIDVSFEELPPPSRQELFFRRKQPWE